MKQIRQASRTAAWTLVALAVGVPSVLAGQMHNGNELLSRLGLKKGICVVLGDRRCELALELAKRSELTLYVQVREADERQAACRAADAAGLYGSRIYVDGGDPARIHLADNLADAVVAAGDPAGIPGTEVLRVLRPGGKALLGQEVLTKPFPDGTDEWSHHYHGPDNNPQANDRLALAPYLTQFIAEPRYAPAPQNVVASAGRVFMAFGHVAWKQRAEPWLNTLVAVNAFNGTILWKRRLTSGIMVDRSTMIATSTALYLGDERSCKVLDPATGKLIDEITVPTDLTGGTFWKWMALDNGVLYALVGEQEPLDRVARWRRTADKAPELFKAIGPYCPYEHARTGWRSTIYLRCSDKALYFAGPQVFDVTAVSTDDGRHLWTYRAQRNPHVLIRGDGTIRLDPTGGNMQWISPMRPACFVGTLVADGHLYWTPWACDCNLQMFGLICCEPAGDFKFDRTADESERLQTPDGLGGPPTPIAHFQQSPNDWPTYRANNARTATTQVAIADAVEQLWTYTPDAAFEATPPVAAGGLVFLGGSDGIVRALHAADGTVSWTAYTGGAVRYPPAVADGRAVVGSGDGYVYAFEAAAGRLLWRFRAAPVERRIRVYDSLLSTWPVAGGVLVHDGVAYCAAGINNYDGTHVYALSAANGKIKWQNNGLGSAGPSRGAGVCVQGDLLLDDGRLYLASGSSASPVAFDTADGKCLSTGQKGRRGRELHLVVAKNEHGEAPRHVQAIGQPLYATPENPVFERNKALEWGVPVVHTKNADLLCRESGDGWKLVAQDPSAKKDLWQQPLPSEPVRWAIAVDARGRVRACTHVLADRRPENPSPRSCRASCRPDRSKRRQSDAIRRAFFCRRSAGRPHRGSRAAGRRPGCRPPAIRPTRENPRRTCNRRPRRRWRPRQPGGP